MDMGIDDISLEREMNLLLKVPHTKRDITDASPYRL